MKNDKVNKAKNLMFDGKFRDAVQLWEEIIKNTNYLQPLPLIEQAICYRHLEEYDRAVVLLTKANTNRSRVILLEFIELIESKIMYLKAWHYVIQETFDYRSAPALTIRMHKLYHTNNTLYKEYNSFLKNLPVLDYYIKLSLGYEKKPSPDYINKIYQTNNISLIKRIASGIPIHRHNRAIIKKYSIYKNCQDEIIKNAYIGFFREENLLKTEDLENKKLKIALCISGQLRGYKKAYATWDKFNFARHDVDLYCCVWNNIGRKKIYKTQLYRHFGKIFSQLFLSKTEGLNEAQIQKKFKYLYAYFDTPSLIEEKELKRFYNAKKTCVVDEKLYEKNNNMYKMHYLIEKSFQLIDNPDDYDLIIRIRPDKSVEKFDYDWNEIYNTLNETSLISDIKPSIHDGVGLVIGDQFAVSFPGPMKVYSETFSKVTAEKGVYRNQHYKGFRPHMSLFLALLEKNIDVFSLPSKIKFGQPLDTDKISKDLLIKLISKDLNDEKELKKEFVAAIQADYKGN